MNQGKVGIALIFYTLFPHLGSNAHPTSYLIIFEFWILNVWVRWALLWFFTHCSQIWVAMPTLRATSCSHIWVAMPTLRAT